ncbi:hypothetical protein HUN01_29135 [Nostoc edaphicum CCNP1411]|uniref:Uncharacterized protein n=1 Tax=Nostoc edaphicum CCNP1411 TaxID=1472755 RepID=A0A7D7QQP5_9NOSO|nr:hypothetical protein [Nostoc edaphicum]QMS91465.1 hypothetical protein HUN01_29135 [Nostoc edaphicum CCNP1411]
MTQTAALSRFATAFIAQYGSVKARDAIRRQDERLILVETAIYRVFGSRIFIKKP